jgi:hypothetical protein
MYLLVEMDTNPDLQALDANTDLDPGKYLISYRIRN